MDSFLFIDQLDGACLHQGPTRKRNVSGNPELTDQYVTFFDDSHKPGHPHAVADSKVSNFSTAEKTTVFHSVNTVNVQHNLPDSWPLSIGFPNTENLLEIQVHIPVHKAI